MADFVCERVKSCKYKPVETIEAIAESIGLPVDQLVKLNANENVYGAPPEVLEEVSKACHWVYPDPAQLKLRSALAELHKDDGVTDDNVCAGAGSDDILDIVLRVVCPSTIVISTPTFGMYSFLGKAAGMNVIEVPRRKDFTVDGDAVIAAIRDHNATVCFLPSPNNPTGTMLPNDVTEAILGVSSCLLVLDEAYADFCDTSAMSLFGKYDNLVIARTFSKWAGLAGLRLGYSLAHADLTAAMMGIKQPYNVTTATEAAGLAALKHRGEILKSVNALRREKDRMYTRIRDEISWLRPVPSDANFILNEVLGGLNAESVYMALRRKGVLIRYFGTQGGDLSNYIRISAGKPEHTDCVIDTLKAIGLENFTIAPALKETETQAVLFDMDGVLADVSMSQHEAIIQTAKLYGVTVTEADIGRMKAAGNANNDWIVTVNLINEANVSPPATLDTVTKQWEEIYQGTDTTPGLWEIEDLLVDAQFLRRIAAVRPIGIVTGRPRADAERFLKQHDIADTVTCMVCMGEATSKPSPEGVILALDKLGVSRVVFVGDTVDDVNAAVAATDGNTRVVVSLGVCPPACDVAATGKLLTDCGAAQVLSQGCHELGDLLGI